ncbi:MAG TPA: hypothetical protein VI685_15400 [Candidatus Angelobacter sp.]
MSVDNSAKDEGTVEILAVRGLVKETYNGVFTSGQGQGMALTRGLTGGQRCA